MLRRRAPLIVGSLLILGLIGFVALYRSSPGDLARGHAAVAGSPLITDCNKCHASKGLTAGCLSCHTEIQKQLSDHTGYHDYLAKAKKTECARCHSDHNGADFALVNKVSWEGKDFKLFNHPHVDYHLTGAHVKLACEQCHAEKYRPPYALPKYPKQLRKDTYFGLSQKCISCHADPHAGGRAWNCKACHDQNKWKPAPFFNHDKFYPLRGGHDHLKCAQCHMEAPEGLSAHAIRRVVFGPTKGKRCIDCHANPHFTRWVESCEACHNRDDLHWNLADKRMTKRQHVMTGFRLIIPHHKTQCLECHGPDMPGVPFKVKYPNPHESGYKRFEKNCEACHKDAHRGQFVDRHPRCIDCHSRIAFMPTTYGVNDHRTYPLIGGHRIASCNVCHIKDRNTHVRQYNPTPKACAACHKDIHYGQFRKENDKTRCEDCHLSTASWSKLVFNHNTQSRYILDKTHAQVACAKCHFWVTARGVKLVQYKPLGMKCKDCHAFEK